MIVPHDKLSPAALDAVIEEYVSRDGTELSEASVKATVVRRALDTGELVLVYDADAESCTLLTPDQAELRLRELADRESHTDGGHDASAALRAPPDDPRR